MMRISGRAIFTILLLASLLSLLGRLFGSRPWFVSGLNAQPVLQYPQALDLGEHEQRSIAVGRFQIKNAGTGVLILDQFQTSCACAGIEREVEGKFLKVHSIKLQAGESIDLVLRASVTGRAGDQLRIACSFRSNDPRHPQGFIEALVSRIRGGVITIPTSILFGTLTVGQQAKHLLSVYDGGQSNRQIQAVRSTQPERFRARLLTNTFSDPLNRHETAGRLIGQVEIIPNTKQEGALDGEVEITLKNEDRQPDRISVSGMVKGEVEVAPQSILLPRRVREQICYFAEIQVWHRGNQSLFIREVSETPDLLVQVLPHAPKPDCQRVRVEWKPPNSQKQVSKVQRRIVRLAIRVGDGKEIVREVLILLHNQPRSP